MKRDSYDDEDDDLDFDDDDDDFDTSNSKSNSISTSNKFSSSARPTGMTATSVTSKFSAGAVSSFAKPTTSTAKSTNPDPIIKLLLSDSARAIGVNNSELTEDMINGLIDKAQDVITAQPVFLQLTGPVKIVSDIHG